MALIKSTNLPYDGEAVEAYWKIIETNINWLTKSSHVTISAWIDQEARENGKQPFTSRSFDWSGDEFDFDVEGKLVSQAYIKIKAETVKDQEGNETPGEFANAVDC